MQPDANAPTTLEYAPAVKPNRTGWLNGVLFLVAPFVVLVIYVVFSRWPSRIFTTRSDYVFQGIACLAGAFFAARLPLPTWLRVALVLVYATVIYFLIDRIMLYAVGYIHDDWL